MNSVFLPAIITLLVSMVYGEGDYCPAKCVCKRSIQRDGSTFIKLKCGEVDKITNFDEIDLLNIASEIIHFNLSGNSLSTFHPRVQLIALQKLDLSNNQLTDLQSGQFSEFPNLRRLDISENHIKTIDLSAFLKLDNLERLKLSQNQINSISTGTFDPLTSLNQLDISNNPLTCDCGLLWLLDWSAKSSVKLISNPKCSTPSTFKGLPLRKLKIGVDIHCKSPASTSGIPIIEMKPDANQVVFEGDTLKLQCKAPTISDAYDSVSEIEWTWLDSDPKSYFSDVTIENHFLQSTGLIDSSLRIPQLKPNHTGIWNCRLISMQGNHSKGITIVVISNSTRYCPVTVTSNNKGTYTWPRTIVNYTTTIPCESINLNYDVALQNASYFCSEQAKWENLNTSMCSYISDTTKILEQFSKVNSSVMESAKHFRNYTYAHRVNFKDVMDIVFAVETMENYLKHLSINQIGGVLMDIMNNLLELPKEYLEKANQLYHICDKLVNITEKLAGITSTSQLHKSNIAVEIFPMKRNGFSGLKCTWYVDMEKASDRLFYCVTNSQTDTAELHGKISEASVIIPENLFYQLKKDRDYNFTNKFHNILVSMHANNKLFPVNEMKKRSLDVTSAVVGAKLVDRKISNLTDPVFIMLKISPLTHYETSSFVPAWWDPQLNNGTGDWTTEGCQFSHEYQDHVVFFCHNFGYYGLLQNISRANYVNSGAKFKFSHPAIYVGSFILLISLLVTIVTYLLSYASIQMPKKAKHSLINLWISICFLCFMYLFGIYQTEDSQICQIVGMLLHYFTISSLLWICVGVNCMYKRFSKNNIMELQDDELTSGEPIKKPIIGLYFVGWGIAIILCGISAAINIKDYASPTYCFLRIGPPLSALYIPFAILLIFLGIFFLLIRCSIYNLDANGHLSEGTQATENVDLDLLEPNFPNPDSRSAQSVSFKTASSEVEDPEHLPSAQLKAYVIFLFLYVLSWLSCAFATVEPYHFISFEKELFSGAYAILVTILSAFTLFFYCVARSDVRAQWFLLGHWIKRKQFCFRSRNVSDAAQNLPQIQIQRGPLPPVSNSLIGDVHGVSRSSSRTSSHTKSNSHASNVLKAAIDLNVPSHSETHGAKINNINLILLHRQQYRSNIIPNIIENPTNAAEVFYNPHQSIVARKFFKRQKRHLMKRNNLAPRQRDHNTDSASVISELKQVRDNSSIDQSIFGTNSKVNNTNIHVEHVRKKPLKNLNLFSDSAEDIDSVSNVPLQNLVLNAERNRKREVLKHKSRKKQVPKKSDSINNMRSVSQQCTLEYSSETMSDSILDKTSPEKKLLGADVDDFMIYSLKQNNPAVDASINNENESFYYNVNDNVTHREELEKIFTKEPCEETDLRLAPPQSSLTEFNSSLLESSATCRLKETVGAIYVNPSHELLMQKGPQSRASSVSVSDLDELYQQIRRGPNSLMSHSRTSTHGHPLLRNSPYFSDSDINSYINVELDRQRADLSNSSSDKGETTV